MGDASTNTVRYVGKVLNASRIAFPNGKPLLSGSPIVNVFAKPINALDPFEFRILLLKMIVCVRVIHEYLGIIDLLVEHTEKRADR